MSPIDPATQALLAAAGDAVLLVEGGRITGQNSVFARWSGWSPQALSSLPVPATLFEDAGGVELKRWPAEGRAVLRCADGTRVSLKVRTVEAGALSVVFLSRMGANDEVPASTNQDARLQGLEAINAQYRELVEGVADGLVMLDAEGRIGFVNRTFAQLLGHEQRAAVLGRPFLELVAPPDRGRIRREASRWERGEVRRFETSLLRADGTLLPVLLSGRGGAGPGDDANRGPLLLVTDFAERRQIVERAETSRRLEGLASLAGGIAHDFNNLLTGVLGNASRIRLTQPEPVIDDAARAIEESAELASRLTQRLLMLVRGQAPHRRLIDVGTVVGQTVVLLRKLIPDGLRLDVDIASALPAVLADEAQLQQAVLNLGLNARDAVAGKQGRITLRVYAGTVEKVCDDGSTATEPAVTIEVHDDGPGIPRGIRARIFDPFFSTKGVARGTGLGLTTVWQLVEAHGGTVEVDDGPFGGARLTVRLPAVPGRIAEPTRSGKGRDRGATAPPPAVVLVAEDERAIRHLVVRTLSQAGHEVLAAEDGEQAIRLWDEHAERIDLLFLDVRMPGAEGPEVLRYARQTHPFVPAVLSSGFIPQGTDASDLGEDISFLPKPYRIPELLETVRRALATHAADGPATLDLTHPNDEPTTTAVSVVARAGLTLDGGVTQREIPVVADLAEDWDESR